MHAGSGLPAEKVKPLDRYDDEEQEDFAQNDGDVSAPAFPGAVAFQPANPGQPWLRAGLPPWHLWGNSQLLTLPVDDNSISRTFTPGQLVKIAYKRPETWHWMLAARLVSGPDAPGFTSIVSVDFELIVGIGRSLINIKDVFQVSHGPGDPGSRPFERYRFLWGPTGLFPRNAQVYSTQVLAPNRVYATDLAENQTGNAVPPAENPTLVDQIVAQDIQVNVSCNARSDSGSPAIGQNVVVEVSGMFAPKNHIRPDWFLNAPDESVFAGGEVAGT